MAPRLLTLDRVVKHGMAETAKRRKGCPLANKWKHRRLELWVGAREAGWSSSPILGPVLRVRKEPAEDGSSRPVSEAEKHFVLLDGYDLEEYGQEGRFTVTRSDGEMHEFRFKSAGECAQWTAAIRTVLREFNLLSIKKTAKSSIAVEDEDEGGAGTATNMEEEEEDEEEEAPSPSPPVAPRFSDDEERRRDRRKNSATDRIAAESASRRRKELMDERRQRAKSTVIEALDPDHLPEALRARLEAHPGWQARRDVRSDATYYFNAETLESRWTLPVAESEEADWEPRHDPKTNAAYFFNPTTGESRWANDRTPDVEGGQAALAAHAKAHFVGDWEPRRDPTSGATYFFNYTTLESRWTLPDGDDDLPDSNNNDDDSANDDDDDGGE